jgi:DegV family protein with EDD domain
MADMRVGVVVDASCDLPHSYIDAHGLIVLPGHLEFGDVSYTDVREPDETLRWYRRHIGDKSKPGRSVAWEIDRIRDLFLEDLIFRFDRVLVLCVSASRARVFSHATQASYQILKGYRERREAVGQTEAFALRVLDTRNVGPGEGILAHEAVTLIQQEAPPFEKLHRTIKERSRHIVSYLVPNDLYYLHNRASRKGENALTLSAYRVGRWLNLKPVIEMRRGKSVMVERTRGFERGVADVLERARSAIRRGHVRGTVVMSYGGELQRIRDLPAFEEFELYAAEQNVALHLAVMSATLAVNVGPGAFALAWLED